ncbi:hypothetical protein JCM8547_004322 [Rhodosporidiobolus lusitaniae]
MVTIRLPRPDRPGSPLLGAIPPARPPPRRFLRVAYLSLPLVILLAVVLALEAPTPAALEPIKQRIYAFGSFNSTAPLRVVDEDDRPGFEVENVEVVKPKKVEWSNEDRMLRRYSWTTPDVHDSLTQQLEALDQEPRRVREWLLKTRVSTNGGTGIGLGARDPPLPIRPGATADKHEVPPRESEGPGLYRSGSPAKYDDLVQEWKTGHSLDICPSGLWQDEYTQMHRDMMNGKREAQLLEFTCKKGELCGGFADRFLGAASIFLYAILSGRAFSMAWQQPAPLDLLFDSPNIDWSRPFNTSSTTPVPYPYSDPVINASRTSLNLHNIFEPQIDADFPSYADNFADGKNASWIQMDFNRGIVVRSFNYTETIAPRLEKLGLTIDNAYSCLLGYLIRPKKSIMQFIAQYTSFFALPEVFTIGLQIRTGDLSIYASRKDQVNTVAHHQHYFDCAAQVAITYAHPSQKVVYYLITDSQVLEQDALRLYGDRVVVTGMKPEHGEIVLDKSEGLMRIKHAADGYARTIAESWIFIATDFQILTWRSGFGKIPTWIRGRSGRAIQLFNEHMDPDFTKHLKKTHKVPKKVDCSSPKALRSFQDMAQDCTAARRHVTSDFRARVLLRFFLACFHNSYGYNPSLALNLTFVALFAVSTLAHLVQIAVARRYWWMSVMVVGGALEILGWSARVWSHYSIESDGYIIQICVLVIAPTFLSAAIYWCGGLIVADVAPSKSSRLLSPKWFKIGFVTADVVSLVIQAIGGGMAATAEDEDREQLESGGNIMLAGIIVQLVVMIFFSLYMLAWSWVARDEVRRSGSRIQLMLAALGVCSVAVIVRGGFRTAELNEGFSGPLAENEPMILLDAIPIAICTLVLNVIHPHWFLRLPPPSPSSHTDVRLDTMENRDSSQVTIVQRTAVMGEEVAKCGWAERA